MVWLIAVAAAEEVCSEEPVQVALFPRYEAAVVEDLRGVFEPDAEVEKTRLMKVWVQAGNELEACPDREVLVLPHPELPFEELVASLSTAPVKVVLVGGVQ